MCRNFSLFSEIRGGNVCSHHLFTFLSLEFELVYAAVFTYDLDLGILPSLAMPMSLSACIFQDS